MVFLIWLFEDLTVSSSYGGVVWIINECGALGGMKMMQETEILGGKPILALFTTAPTLPDLRSNPNHPLGWQLCEL
jgi:hypothetical protein